MTVSRAAASVEQLRADVDVHAVHSQTQAGAASSGATPNFEPTWPVRIDSWVSTSIPGVIRTSIRSTPDARARVELLERVEHDVRSAGVRRRLELLVRLVVPVHDESLAGDARLLREAELPERRHVRAEPLLAEQPHERDVRERLGAVDDERVGRRGAVLPRPRADRLLAVDDERRAELVRERGGRHAADRQLAVESLRRVREEREVNRPRSSSDRARHRRRDRCSARRPRSPRRRPGRP